MDVVRVRSARRSRHGVIALLVAALCLPGLAPVAASAQTTAPERPRELSVACVDARGGTVSAQSAADCTSKERALRLPQDAPSVFCSLMRDGTLRLVARPSDCSTSREATFTVPDSGAVLLCARDRQGGSRLPRGELRRVAALTDCDIRHESQVATPAAPEAVADRWTVSEDDVLVVPAAGVLGNDRDLTGGALTARLVEAPALGTAQLGADGSLRYDPRGVLDALGTGQTSRQVLRYATSDGALESAPALVELVVEGRNDAPLAVADALSTDEDSPASVRVLTNDTDAEGDPLTAVLVSAPGAGTALLAPDGLLSFDPSSEFEALRGGEQRTLSISYLARDGGSDSAATTVAITVTGVDDAPVALEDSGRTDENTPLLLTPLANDHDPEGQPLALEVLGQEPAGVFQTVDGGGLRLDPTTAFDHLRDGQTGVARLSYRALADGAPSTATTVTVQVDGLSSAVPRPDTGTTDEDTPVEVDVLANDDPARGTVRVLTAPVRGAVSVTEQGAVLFDPRGAYDATGGESVRIGTTVQTEDGDPAPSELVLQVSPVPDAPVAAPDTYVVDGDAVLEVGSDTGVLADDTDPDIVDGDDARRQLTAVLAVPPSEGRLDLRSDGSFSYRPVGDLPEGVARTVDFSYRAQDATGLRSAATRVSLLLNGEDVVPRLLAATLAVDEGAVAGTEVGSVVVVDDPGGPFPSLEVLDGPVVVGSPARGADETETVFPLRVAESALLDHERVPVVAVRLRARDAVGQTAVADYQLEVRDVDELPVVGDDLYDVVSGTLLLVGDAVQPAGVQVALRATPGLLANDSDEGPLSVVAKEVSTELAGRVRVFEDGSLTYEPPAGVSGVTDSVAYEVRAGDDLMTGTVRFALTGVPMRYADGGWDGPQRGTSAAPFTTLGALELDAAPGDRLVLLSTPDDTAGITLQTGQELVGRGVALVSGARELLPAAAPTRVDHVGASGVRLADRTTVRGLAVVGSGGAAVVGEGADGVVLDLAAVRSLDGPALSLRGGSVSGRVAETVSLGDASSLVLEGLGGTLVLDAGELRGAVQVVGGDAGLAFGPDLRLGTPGGTALDVSGRTGGVVTVNGEVAASRVVLRDGTPTSAVRLLGRVSLTGAEQDALVATGGGTLELTGPGSTVATTTGVPVTLRGVGLGAGGVRLQSVSADGAPGGVVVSGTSGPGAVVVTGTGTPASGGTLRDLVGPAVDLDGTTGVRLVDLLVEEPLAQGPTVVLDGDQDTSLERLVVDGGTAPSLDAVGSTRLRADGLVLPGTVQLTSTREAVLSRTRLIGPASDGLRLVSDVGTVVTGLRVEDAGGRGISATGSTDLRVGSGTEVVRSDQRGVELVDAVRPSLNGTTVLDSTLDGISVTGGSTLRVGPSVRSERSGGAGLALAGAGGTSTVGPVILRGNRSGGQLAVTATTAPVAGGRDRVLVDGLVADGPGQLVVISAAGQDASLAVDLGLTTANALTSGTDGLRATASGGADLAVTATALSRIGGTGDAVSAQVTDTGTVATFLVRDNDPASGGQLFRNGGAGIRVSSFSGADTRVDVVSTSVVQSGGTGVALTAGLAGTLRGTLSSIAVDGAGCGLTVDACSPTLVQSEADSSTLVPSCPTTSTTAAGISLVATQSGLVDVVLRKNVVTDPLTTGIQVLGLGGAVTAATEGDTVTQARRCASRGPGISVEGQAGGTATLVGAGPATRVVGTADPGAAAKGVAPRALSSLVSVRAAGSSSAVASGAALTLTGGGSGLSVEAQPLSTAGARDLALRADGARDAAVSVSAAGGTTDVSLTGPVLVPGADGDGLTSVASGGGTSTVALTDADITGGDEGVRASSSGSSSTSSTTLTGLRRSGGSGSGVELGAVLGGGTALQLQGSSGTVEGRVLGIHGPGGDAVLAQAGSGGGVDVTVNGLDVSLPQTDDRGSAVRAVLADSPPSALPRLGLHASRLTVTGADDVHAVSVRSPSGPVEVTLSDSSLSGTGVRVPDGLLPAGSPERRALVAVDADGTSDDAPSSVTVLDTNLTTGGLAYAGGTRSCLDVQRTSSPTHGFVLLPGEELLVAGLVVEGTQPEPLQGWSDRQGNTGSVLLVAPAGSRTGTTTACPPPLQTEEETS